MLGFDSNLKLPYPPTIAQIVGRTSVHLSRADFGPPRAFASELVE